MLIGPACCRSTVRMPVQPRITADEDRGTLRSGLFFSPAIHSDLMLNRPAATPSAIPRGKISPRIDLSVIPSSHDCTIVCAVPIRVPRRRNFGKLSRRWAGNSSPGLHQLPGVRTRTAGDGLCSGNAFLTVNSQTQPRTRIRSVILSSIGRNSYPLPRSGNDCFQADRNGTESAL